MSRRIDLSEILQQARETGYFDLADFPGLTLSLEQLKELSSLLGKKKIPFGTASGANNLTQQEALRIVNSLRKGVPPPVDVSSFSVGRKNLVDKFKQYPEYPAAEEQSNKSHRHKLGNYRQRHIAYGSNRLK